MANAPGPAGSMSFLTPTFAADLPRFLLLRESMRALDIDLPHVAVVQTEDYALFRDTFRGDPTLTLVPSAEVLREPVERSRRRGSGRQPRRPYRLVMRGLQALPGWAWSMSGWNAQQLVKLAAGGVVPTDHWTCLDSDTVFLRRITAERFFTPGGRLYLNRRSDPGDQLPGPRKRSARLLGLDASRLDPSVYYVDFPVPLHRQVVTDLLAFIERRHEEPWEEAFLKHGATEYMTYGLYAEHLDVGGRVEPTRLGLTHTVYDYAGGSLTPEFMLARGSGATLVMVHSLLPVGVEVLRAAARETWDHE